MIGNRLILLFEKLKERGIVQSKKDFSELLGIDYGSLNKYLTDKVNLSINDLNYQGFKKADVNLDWLLTGEGEMFKEELPTSVQQAESTVPQETGIPFYDIDVMAHISESLDFADERAAGVLTVPGFRDCFACFPVYGDSMEPKISNGDIIAVSQPIPIDKILWGEIYLVITDCWRVVKTVHPGVTEEYLVLRSINPEYKGDTPVRKDEVYALYLVRGVVSRMGM